MTPNVKVRKMPRVSGDRTRSVYAKAATLRRRAERAAKSAARQS